MIKPQNTAFYDKTIDYIRLSDVEPELSCWHTMLYSHDLNITQHKSCINTTVYISTIKYKDIYHITYPF